MRSLKFPARSALSEAEGLSVAVHVTVHSSLLLALLLAAGMMLAGTAQAGTEYFVDNNRPDDSGNGLSWATAEKTIAAGVADATTAGDIVTVSNGTYNITAQITISQAITVRSYGNGVYGGLANARNTIVKGNGSSMRIFQLSDNGALLDGLAIQNGTNITYGAGVYMSAGGTVSNCVIKSNSGNKGAGLYGGDAGSPTVWNSEIIDNSCPNDGDNSGGGICSQSGTSTLLVRNCLIARNYSSEKGGALYTRNSGKVSFDNCTIVANQAGNSALGGGIYVQDSYDEVYLTNCVVVSSIGYDLYRAGGTLSATHSCIGTYAGSVTWGAGNITNVNPLLMDATEGNYRLGAGSPCIDTGTNQTWMVAGVKDLDGNDRKINGNNDGSAIVDMGAYEYNTALNCYFVGSPRYLISGTTYQCYGGAPFTVTFTGTACGTNLSGVVYRWDFEGNDTWSDWATGNTTSRVYATPGTYSPKLQVSNSTAEVAQAVKTNYVRAGNVYCVAQGATGNYSSWANAGGTITGALALATAIGDTVFVSNGTYTVSASIEVTNNHILLAGFGNGVYGGLANASNTIVQGDGGNIRIFYSSASVAGAVIDGLTFRNGKNVNGAGMYIQSGSVRNCISRDNFCDRGGGMYMAGSVVVSNCVITANTATGRGGAGIYQPGWVYPTFVNCQITDNYAYSGGDAGGGGSYNEGGYLTFRNCLIARNGAGSEGGGCFNRGSGGLTFESCTIVSNYTTSADAGGGIRKRDGGDVTIKNSIVYFNVDNTGPDNVRQASGNAYYSYTCTAAPDLSGTGMTNANPQFVNLGAGDYRLLKTSPCIDVGWNDDSWMNGAKDLAGNDRKLYGGVAGSKASPIVDMGAYETYVPPKGTVFVIR